MIDFLEQGLLAGPEHASLLSKLLSLGQFRAAQNVVIERYIVQNHGGVQSPVFRPCSVFLFLVFFMIA